jgi:hypothetical protein
MGSCGSQPLRRAATQGRPPGEVSSPPLPNRSVGARYLFSNLLHGRVAGRGTTRSGGAGPAAAPWILGGCWASSHAPPLGVPTRGLLRPASSSAGTRGPRASSCWQQLHLSTTLAPPQLCPPWTQAALPTAGCQLGRGGGRRRRRPHPSPRLLPTGDHCSATRMA